MFILVGLLAAVACATAEPQVLRYDLPYAYHNLGHIGYPGIPAVSRVIPEVYPYHYNLPYYTGLKSQYYERDFIGQASYGHVEPGQSHYAVQDAAGNKYGAFNYYDPTGKLVETSYIADGAGYRVISNNLPIDHSVAPLPVDDTPEVKLAKLAHLEAVEKAKYRARRDIRVIPGIHSHIVSPWLSRVGYPHIVPAALPTTKTIPIVRNDGFLEDTSEVKFAKQHHLLEVEAAKIRNLAPVTPIGYPYTPYSTFGYPYVNRVLGY